MPDLPRGGVTVPKTDFGGFDSCIGHKNVTILWHFFVFGTVFVLYYIDRHHTIMHKEEIELLLSKSGFSVSLNRKIEKTSLTHMIHVGQTPMRLVDYTVDEIKNTVKSIWAYHDDTLDCIENIPDLKIWLGE